MGIIQVQESKQTYVPGMTDMEPAFDDTPKIGLFRSKRKTSRFDVSDVV
jgi:hypothetical protein